MADVVVVGSGLVGMTTAMLLAGDGHRVTVLERDPEPPPPTAEEQVHDWKRRGVRQFAQAHYFTPRMRQELERELPEVVVQAEALGARRMNPVLMTKPTTGITERPGDERFEAVTARRPVMEAAFAMTAAGFDAIDIRRGVAVKGLVTDGDVDGVPRVVGVHTEDGLEVRGDLVVDASGRGSPLPKWLDAIGAKPPGEHIEDVGFTYFGRHFRSADLPDLLVPLHSQYATNGILTLPCDNDTWVVGFIALSSDAPMRALLDADTWTRAVQAFPKVAHWIDAEPVDERIMTMSKIEDRVRRYVVDGRPVACGLLAVGDSWACSNPSLGRGSTIGLLHALAFRDAVRAAGTDAPWQLTLAFEETTAGDPQRWLEATLGIDLARKAEIDAALRGEELALEPPQEMAKAFLAAAYVDEELTRGFGEIGGMLTMVDDVIGRPGVFERIIEHGVGWRDMRPPGPGRDELLEILGAGK